MGCFSFLCKVSDKPANSTSFDGDPCRLFLLKEGKVIEEMHGNYDSYGRVFNKDGDSFKWQMDWGDVCTLMFSHDESNGIAMILDDHYDGSIPDTRSENDPEQGWSKDGPFVQVENPYHIIKEQ